MAYMHVNYNVTKHGTGLPSNTNAQHYGQHILNIKLTSDTDNGQLIAANPAKWVSWDVFEEAAVTTFEGRVVDKTPNGNYLVLVTKTDGLTCLCYQKPITGYEAPRELTKEDAFYNKKDDIVRGYVLDVWDRFESSASNFSTEPEVGATITGVANKKMTVVQPQGATGATGETH